MTEIILKLVNTTPLLIGWHDPLKSDPLGLRTTEVKGLWRWWCRAFIGGAMYERGLLKGYKERNAYLIPTKEEVSIISCLIGDVMGLGRASREKSVSSRFMIWTEPIDKELIKDFSREKKYQRIRLLSSFGDRSVEGIPPGIHFKLHVKKIKDQKLCQTVAADEDKIQRAEITALKILLLSLQLSGVGKGARRGLGSLDMVDIESKNVEDLSHEKLNNKKLKQLIEEVHEECGSIVDDLINFCCRDCKEFVSQDSKVIPPFPVITRKRVSSDGELRLTNIMIVEGSNPSDFERIHNFFLRSERSRSIHVDYLSKKRYAWIMGLPRSARYTGYIIESKGIIRRASPIFIVFHTNKNILGSGIFVTMLISGDWPSKLKHHSGKSPKTQTPALKSIDINIDENTILSASKTFLNEFHNFFRGRVQNIWP